MRSRTLPVGPKLPLQRSPVHLRVYDISNGKAALWSRLVLRRKIDGIWHTEFPYVGGGIDCMASSQVEASFDMEIVETRLLGYTSRTRDEFEKYLLRLHDKFTPETYDLVKWNCNHFSDACSRFLLENRGIPDDILRLPEKVGSTFLGGIVLNVFKRVTQGKNPACFSPDHPAHPRHEFFPTPDLPPPRRRPRLRSLLQGCMGDEDEQFSIGSPDSSSRTSNSDFSEHNAASAQKEYGLRSCSPRASTRSSLIHRRQNRLPPNNVKRKQGNGVSKTSPTKASAKRTLPSESLSVSPGKRYASCENNWRAVSAQRTSVAPSRVKPLPAEAVPVFPSDPVMSLRRVDSQNTSSVSRSHSVVPERKPSGSITSASTSVSATTGPSNSRHRLCRDTTPSPRVKKGLLLYHNILAKDFVSHSPPLPPLPPSIPLAQKRSQPPLPPRPQEQQRQHYPMSSPLARLDSFTSLLPPVAVPTRATQPPTVPKLRNYQQRPSTSVLSDASSVATPEAPPQGPRKHPNAVLTASHGSTSPSPPSLSNLNTPSRPIAYVRHQREEDSDRSRGSASPNVGAERSSVLGDGSVIHVPVVPPACESFHVPFYDVVQYEAATLWSLPQQIKRPSIASFRDGLMDGFLLPTSSRPLEDTRKRKVVACPECGEISAMNDLMCRRCGLDFMLIPKAIH